MVWDEICDDMQTLRMRFLYKLFDILYGTETRVNRVEISDMVSMVRGGFIEGGDLECCNTKIDKVWECVDDPSDGSP